MSWWHWTKTPDKNVGRKLHKCDCSSCLAIVIYFKMSEFSTDQKFPFLSVSITEPLSPHSPTPERSGAEPVGMHRSARRAESYWKDKQSCSNYSYKAEKYGCNFIRFICWVLNNETSPPAQVCNISIMQTPDSLFQLWCHAAYEYLAVNPPVTWHQFSVYFGKQHFLHEKFNLSISRLWKWGRKLC